MFEWVGGCQVLLVVRRARCSGSPDSVSRCWTAYRLELALRWAWAVSCAAALPINWFYGGQVPKLRVYQLALQNKIRRGPGARLVI